MLSLWPLLLLILLQPHRSDGDGRSQMVEFTIDEIQSAFDEGTLTSRRLVEFYLDQISALNPVVRAVIEVNPDALVQADRADAERAGLPARKERGLHGVPVLLKDNIGTADRMNTTAGSLALVGSVVRRDSGVVERLRRAGAVLLGKASMSEWAHFRSDDAPSGWCARSGQGKVEDDFLWFVGRSDDERERKRGVGGGRGKWRQVEEVVVMGKQAVEGERESERKGEGLSRGRVAMASDGGGGRSDDLQNKKDYIWYVSMQNPYLLTADPCGSSSGSSIAVAANMAAVSLGTETDGSILCPASANSVVGIKPTVGLTSRAGVIPISPRQDTIGPICRTVSDAVHVLDAIVGFDPRDSKATKNAEKFIPQGGYKQFLKVDGLKGKRLGILRNQFFGYAKGSISNKTFEKHFETIRSMGAILVDNLTIANYGSASGETTALLAEFKLSINTYLSSELTVSPVRSLGDVIAFNNNHKHEERMDDIDQMLFLEAENTNGIGPKEEAALREMRRLSRKGLEKLMNEEALDAIVTPESSVSSVLAIGGYPGISIPAGYNEKGVPFGICFGGLRWSEPRLIEIAYGFEQATKVRKPPLFK
ncbi:hypothetical protein QJS04_geneDACA009587 [Acorus gramineus]|uniref:Amidase domain-containing protein n=1 Tax=Acorus gramineus TaxID=55184 RepID=A0AAV9BEF2_ACOGR|nr:hypothetical protein QJS04_geneDACA009587 [Acorus gramineus]